MSNLFTRSKYWKQLLIQQKVLKFLAFGHIFTYISVRSTNFSNSGCFNPKFFSSFHKKYDCHFFSRNFVILCKSVLILVTQYSRVLESDGGISEIVMRTSQQMQFPTWEDLESYQFYHIILALISYEYHLDIDIVIFPNWKIGNCNESEPANAIPNLRRSGVLLSSSHFNIDIFWISFRFFSSISNSLLKTKKVIKNVQICFNMCKTSGEERKLWKLWT